MADLINNLIDFRYTTKMDCITNYLHEHSGRICNRLWISSPFISSEKIFYYIFQISKIKKHKPNFRLLTDLNNISINNYKILKFFLGNNCELRSLKHLHAKMYLMDDYSVVTSANMTYRGLYVNYETGVAGDILDVDRFEAMYNEIWELGTPVNQEMLDEALNNSTYIDTEGFNPDLKPIIKLPKELTEKCSYEQFLNEYNELSKQYESYGRIWKNSPLKFEIDSFLNYLFHHSENNSSKDYYYSFEVNNLNSEPKAKLLKNCIQEYHNWIISDSVWDNEGIRMNYRKNALEIFSDQNIDSANLEDISEFLANNINTYLTNSVRFNWKEKFAKENNVKDVKSCIQKLKIASPKELDKLIKNSSIRYFGESTAQEVIGLLRDELPIRNENTNSGLRYLGYNV